MYKKLLENGWTLNDIDEMDIHFYFSLYNDEDVFIDEANIL